jgi:hypothetical protein
MLPAGAIDREAAQGLLAWMMSPEIVAEVAYDSAMLPTSRTAAQDPRFGGIPDYQVFLELVTHPNAGGAGPAPISRELNEALARVEDTLLERGGDAMSLLNEVQAELAPRLEEATVD